MYKIAKASEQDRRVLFRNTAQQTGLHEANVSFVCRRVRVNVVSTSNSSLFGN